jgi:hypothetical protein
MTDDDCLDRRTGPAATAQAGSIYSIDPIYFVQRYGLLNSQSTHQGGGAVDVTKIWETIVRRDGGNIVYVIMDGVGGLPHPERGGTELQVAQTPRLDRLAKESACGLLEMIGPGITPGSSDQSSVISEQYNDMKILRKGDKHGECSDQWIGTHWKGHAQDHTRYPGDGAGGGQ